MPASIPVPAFGWRDLFRAVWHFLGRKHRWSFVFWTLVIVALSLCSMVPAYFTGRIIEFFVHWHQGLSLRPAYGLAIFIGVWYACVAEIRLFTKRQLAGLQIQVVYNARVEGFQRLLEFPLRWHAQENTGNKMQRIQNGVTNLRSMIKTLSSNFLPSTVPFLAAAILFIRLDWRVAVFTVTYVAIAVVNEGYFYRKIRPAIDEQNKATERSTGTSYEGANNVLTVKAMGASDALISSVISREECVRDASLVSRHLGIAKWQWFQAINGLAYAVFVALLVMKFSEGTLAIGLFATYFAYFRLLIDGVSQGSECVSDCTEFLSAVGRMMPIYTDDIPAEQGNAAFPSTWNGIHIANLAFTYSDSSRPALDGVTMNVGRGEKIGIAGESGSGKSTLSKILLQLYQPSAGGVFVDKMPLEQIDCLERIANMTVVLQEAELFNLTFRENLTLCKEVPEDVVQSAIRIACLEEVIAELSEGLDTLIGEKGYRLSGGQRQRLGIARAICAMTDIIILDEATSSLDSITEARIQENFQRELSDKTLIVIAHRLSTLRETDRVYVMVHGRVAESGRFTELANSNGHFSQMYNIQSISDPALADA
jgi:ABC-type multidrug transport system fused ATPase/permease subunit